MNDKNRCFGCMEERRAESLCPICGYHEGSDDDASLHLIPGTVLNDTYLIGRVLGQGGFGITYLGWDLNLNIKLAVKEYFPQQYATRLSGKSKVSAFSGSLGSQYAYGLDKFLQEARTLAQFEGHPNIVAVRNYFQANDTAYLVMSFVEGVTLKEYLKSTGKAIPFNQVLSLVMPVLDALREVHAADILHRDISPDNIFINKKGQVVLLDFGAARQAIGEKDRSISIILKPGYAPEEQYRSRGKQGPWTDVYAVAATMYHLVTAMQPPEALERLVEDALVPPSQMGVAITVNQEQALLKALAVSASNRFQTVEAFQAALIEDNTTALSGSFALNQQPGIKGFDYQAAQMAPQVPAPVEGSDMPQVAQEPSLDHVSYSAESKPAGKKLSPLAIGGTVLFALAVLIFFAIKIFSGSTEPAGQLSETLQDEADNVPATVDEQALVEGTIDLDGGIYSGQLLGGVAHGYGVWTGSDGVIYEGDFAHDMFNGQGVWTRPNGERYEGQFKDDLFHGEGIYTWPNGERYEGEYKNGSRDGWGIYTWPVGDKYEGEYKNDLRNGLGIYTFSNGERYEGEYKNDLMHGQGKYTFADGIVWEGTWEEDEFKGN